MINNHDGNVSIYDRNIQYLATEMYEVSNTTPVVRNIFTEKITCPYYLQLYSRFSSPLVRSVFHGTESISYLGPVIWSVLLDIYKNLPNFSDIRNRIKKWKPYNCPCKRCKTYISRVGFIYASTLLSWIKLWHFSQM